MTLRTQASPVVVHAAAQADGRTVSLGGPSKEKLDAAYAQCAEIARRRARNFYYGLRLTPEPRRSAIYSIYAWMRNADDEADAAGSSAERRARLARHRAITASILAGQHSEPSAAPYWWAFAATVANYPIERGIFDEMIDGLEEDIDHGGYASEAELTRYCYRVASTVGLVCISIWGLAAGADEVRVRDLATRRGQAFQRTNILRDFAQDFECRPRRVYLPTDAFERAGLTPEQVRAWSDPEACRRFMLGQAAVARQYYLDSEGLENMIDPACAPTLWAMTRIYSGLLGVIEVDPERIVRGRRVRLASARKAGIALAATWRARTGRW